MIFQTHYSKLQWSMSSTIKWPYLDTRVGTNILPLSIYIHLKNKGTMESNYTLYNFQQQAIQTHGIVAIKVYVQGIQSKTMFQVANCGMDKTIILGNP